MSERSQSFDGLKITSLFAPGNTAAWEFLVKFTYPWEVLPEIKNIILKIGESLNPGEYEKRGSGVWIHKSAAIAPTAFMGEAVIVAENAEIRHCAFIRGGALIGKNAVVGNSTELKNVILSDGVQVPHYNYVGDSILGYKAHMGAGAITSNVKSDSTPVSVVCGGERIETKLKKFGAILGDHAEIGCNSVLNPGAVVGKNANVYPLSMVRGYVPENSIYKKQGEVVKKRPAGQ